MIMGAWKEYRLGELGVVITGKTPSKDNPEDWGNKMLFITPSDYKHYRKKAFFSERKLSLSGIERLRNKILPKNSLLVTCIGSDMGKVVMNYEEAITNQQINAIIPDNETVNNDFLYYRLVDLYEILAIYGGDGTAVPIVNKRDFENIETEIPPLSEQRAIAAVLSSLDDKIDLLRRQNVTLEKMAETLFRQWFVEEAKDVWEEKSLYNCIELVGGGTPKTEKAEYWNGTINWLSGGDIAGNHKNFVVFTEKTITDLGLNNSSAKLLPRYSTVVSARGTVGKYCLLARPMAFSQSNYGVLPKYKNCFFFTYLLLAHCIDELLSAAYGSVFDTITTNTFKGINIRLPNEKHIIIFEEKLTPYFKKMIRNQNQINTLTQLRDTLLPKLMSGEVKVVSSHFSGDTGDPADTGHGRQGHHCPPTSYCEAGNLSDLRHCH